MIQNNVKVIGITGGIATGKSTVSQIIRNEGFQVIDSDSIARKVVERGSKGLALIINEFGKDLLMEDGNLDRERLGEIIFNDDNKRETLNSLLHPLIRESMVSRISQAAGFNKVVFVDIPLLFESRETIEESGVKLDEVWLVYTEEAIQLSRLMNRNNYKYEEALARIRSQMDIEKKRLLSDRLIDNSGSVEDTRKQVLDLLNEYR